MRGYNFKVLLWKELLDLSRDYKTLATSLLLPLIFFPLLGFLSLALVTQQPVNIAIVDMDREELHNKLLNLTFSSRDLVNRLINGLEGYGFNVYEAIDSDVVYNSSVDLVIIIPKGFTFNLSSLNSTAHIEIYRRANVQASARAEAIARAIINEYSNVVSKEKVEAIIKVTRLNATSTAILYPISTKLQLVTVGGREVGMEEELKGLFARVLVLALSVVITPATSFIIDGIIGERERKTIEMILSLPLPVSLIIYSKLVAATMLGLLTAIADALGFVAYIVLTTNALGGNVSLPIDPILLLLHSVVAFFTILVTISIALPFITRTRGIRSASNIASGIAIIGTIVFFTGFIVDYSRLPTTIKSILYIIPYTHSILSIQYYVVGYTFQAMLHLLVLVILSLVLLAFSTKILNTEKMLLAPST